MAEADTAVMDAPGTAVAAATGQQAPAPPESPPAPAPETGAAPAPETSPAARGIDDLKDEELSGHERVKALLKSERAKAEESARRTAENHANRQIREAETDWVRNQGIVQAVQQLEKASLDTGTAMDPKTLGQLAKRHQLAAAFDAVGITESLILSRIGDEASIPQKLVASLRSAQDAASAGKPNAPEAMLKANLDIFEHHTREQLREEVRKEIRAELKAEAEAADRVASLREGDAARSGRNEGTGVRGGETTSTRRFATKHEVVLAHARGEIDNETARHWRNSNIPAR